MPYLFTHANNGIYFLNIAHTCYEVIYVSYINPKIQHQFESLSIDLKNEILSRDVRIENLRDLIAILERIVSESKNAP